MNELAKRDQKDLRSDGELLIAKKQGTVIVS